MKNPLLSIIVPVYNVEPYLVDCLESIINQSFEDFELILIDDGSTDYSGHIIDNYAIKDKRIVVIHQKNQGLSGARNAGLDLAKGEYITFVDSDDKIQEDTYKKNMEVLLKDFNIDALQFPTSGFFDNTKIVYNKIFVGESDVFTNWWEGNILNFSMCNKIFHNKIFSNIRYPIGHVFEDYFLVVELSNIIKKIYISNKGCYFYRVREGSISSGVYSLNKNLDLFTAQFNIYKKLYSYEHLRPSRLRAFSRVYRRLLTTKLAYPDSNLTISLRELKQYIPLFSDIKLSKDRNEYIWILCVKTLGLSTFMYLFCFYLKTKNKLFKSG